jgi:hypothetical protein
MMKPPCRKAPPFRAGLSLIEPDAINTYFNEKAAEVRNRSFIKIAPENPALWAGMKGASAKGR